MANSSVPSSSSVPQNHPKVQFDNTPLRQFFLPKAFEPQSPIECEGLYEASFEIKPELLVMLPRFHGVVSQSPIEHITDFIEVALL